LKYDEEIASLKHIDAAAGEENSYIGSVVGSVDGAISTSSTNPINNQSVAAAVGPGTGGLPASSNRAVIKTRKRRLLALLGVVFLLAIVLAVVLVTNSGESKSSNNIAGINDQQQQQPDAVADETTLANVNEELPQDLPVDELELRDELLNGELSSDNLLVSESSAPSQMPSAKSTSGSPTSAPSQMPSVESTSGSPTSVPTDISVTTTTIPTSSPKIDGLDDAAAATDEGEFLDPPDVVVGNPVDNTEESTLWDNFVDGIVDTANQFVDGFNEIIDATNDIFSIWGD